MSFDRSDLLCYATLPDGHGFEASIAAAAKAGFRELSLWLMSIDAAREELGSLQAVKDCLDRHAMRATCLELFLAWPQGDETAARGEIEVMQAAAEVFEPELIMAACLEPTMVDEARACEMLKMQCRAMAPLKVALEFLPWSAVPDIPTVRRFAESVDEDNLGFVIDTWHFARSGQDFDALAQIPGERIFFVQLGDAAAVPEEDVFAETLGARVPPGEGVVDWPRLMATLDTMGVNCPMGTEMFSNAVKAMPLDEACAFLYSTMKKAFG